MEGETWVRNWGNWAQNGGGIALDFDFRFGG